MKRNDKRADTLTVDPPLEPSSCAILGLEDNLLPRRAVGMVVLEQFASCNRLATASGSFLQRRRRETEKKKQKVVMCERLSAASIPRERVVEARKIVKTMKNGCDYSTSNSNERS